MQTLNEQSGKHTAYQLSQSLIKGKISFPDTNAGELKDLFPEQIDKMETEMANLQREMKLIEDSYGPDHLNLVLARGYLVSSLNNTRVEHYLSNNHGEILGEFRKISDSTSIGNETI